MSKHVLFVCQSCHHSSQERAENQLADGTLLLNQLNTLYAEQFPANELEIQPVGCLGTCDRPCAVAFSALHKPTFLFTNLPLTESTVALLQFGEVYLANKTGDISGKYFPQMLRSASIAKIPPVE
ncbi:DUF1636 family protein [Chlorogloeopsis sp. ULAP01]|uniref:DUF1636 family protein n=1 Tax=Chlorogloeopsis sp. ULAP01 TaxID=3056483 RepID=UPI0025AACA1C|nr:DUF1636 family protein [Chlorogloeopsis sp. ULAP01]MDM9382061.1 DUF1636 family protein [Chlorogloeopsis sp. ULAP01]